MKFICSLTQEAHLWRKSSPYRLTTVLTILLWNYSAYSVAGKQSAHGVGENLQTVMLKHLKLENPPRFSDDDLSLYRVPIAARIKYESLMQKRLRLGGNATSIIRRQRSAEPSLADLFKSIHKKSGILGDVVYSDTFREKLEFDMEGKVPPGSAVTVAELRLFKKLPNIPNKDDAMLYNNGHPRNNRAQRRGNRRKLVKKVKHARVSIYHTIQQQNGKEKSNLIDSRLIAVNGSGWHSFDITKAVKEWQLHPVRFMSISLELHVDSVRPGRAASAVARLVRFSGQSVPKSSPRRPELLVFTEENEEAKSNDCAVSSNPRRRKCCRESRFINFRELPWADGWIIEPAGYDAYQCAGRCSARRQRNNRGDSLSCIVTETAPLPVMYLAKRGGRTQVEVAELPDMIVKKCGCSRDNTFL